MQDLRRRMGEGVDAVIAEFEAYQGSGSDEYRECLNYVLHSEAGSDPTNFQGGLKRDCDARGDLLPSRRRRDGRGMQLADFLASHTAQECNLEEVHVVSMRVYTSGAFQAINNPLRDQERDMRGEPHPFAVTAAHLREAMLRMRASNRDENQVVNMYRGMRDVRIPDEFLQVGGLELAPMSVTFNLRVALQYGVSRNSVLLRVRSQDFSTRAPDLSFLSCYPAEDEGLFPPFTYFRPTGVTEDLEVDDARFHVIEVEPRF